MIVKFIRWSLANRFLVMLITGLLVAAGIYAAQFRGKGLSQTLKFAVVK